MKEILISGYYGFGNSGDDALLLSIIKDFERKGVKENITVLSANPKETKRMYGVNAVNRINPFALVYHFVKCRLFISGGGTLIQDGTSTKSLLYYLYLIKTAKIFGKKVMLYANGIGPVNREKNRVRVRKVLNTVDCITVRDKKSYNEIVKLGITSPHVELTADPVFLLDSDENIDGITEKYSPDRIICVAVRDTKTAKPDFVSNLAHALDSVSEKYGVTAVLLPFQDTDKEISRKIAFGMKNKPVMIEEHLSVGQVMSLVGMSEMCIGMRLHMLIYAASKAVPIVGIVYDPKVSGFMEYAGQNLYVDVSDVKKDSFAELVDRCMAENVKRHQELENVRDELRKRAALNSDIAMQLYEKGEF